MKTLLPFLVILFIAGCEILEEDISNKKVPIIAPADRVTVTAGSIDFRWQGVEHAVGYEFSVVSPSFAAAERIVIDTVIYADTLDRRFGCRVTLPKGDYEWSVAGFNGGYLTRTEVRNLTVLPAEVPEDPEEPENPEKPEESDVPVS